MAENDVNSAFDVYKEGAGEVKKGSKDQTSKIFLCNVIGNRGAGKTSFMQGFLGRNLAVGIVFCPGLIRC